MRRTRLAKSRVREVHLVPPLGRSYADATTRSAFGGIVIGLDMMVGKRMSATSARGVLVAFFLAAACQADEEPSEEDYFETRDQLNCDLLLECGQLMSEDECTMGSALGECSEFNASAATACLEAMEDALDAAQADAKACSDPIFPQECNSVITWSGSAECGTTAGRPLFIDGQQLLPPVVRACPPGETPRALAAEHWLQCARMESASVPAFTRLASELASVGAPSSMQVAAQDAAKDEIRHTQLCLDVARQLVDTEFDLGPLPEVPGRPDITVETLAIEALIEGCIGEGSAAAWASIAGNGAGRGVAQTLRDIAADELQHAALSWRVIGWALRRQPGLSTALLAALDNWERADAANPVVGGRKGLAEHGVLSSAAERATARELVSVVVRPTLLALCRRSERIQARA